MPDLIANASRNKEKRTIAFNITGSNVDPYRWGMDVRAYSFVKLVASDAAESGSSEYVINATAHTAIIGDLIEFTSGSLNGQIVSVYATSANQITLAQTLGAAIGAGDTFNILRASFPVLSSSGGMTVDTELEAAHLLADGDPIPFTPDVGAIVRGQNASGTIDTAKLAKAHDVDSGGGTEYATGVSWRKTASGGSVEFGTSSDPVRTDPTGTTTQPISVASLPLPSGAATESTLSTLNSKVTACNTGAVTISAALPAGTNAIGKLAANSGVDIGDVDVTSIIPGTGATNLGKAEDAAHTSADTGVMALGVRRDTLAAGAGTDGDYEAIPVASISSTLGVPAHIVGTIALPVVSDVASGAALNSTSAVPIAGPDVTTGNKGNIESAASAVTTSTARGAVVRQVGFPAAATMANGQSSPSTVRLGACNQVYNGSTWDMQLAVTNGLNSTGTGIAAAGLVGQLDDTSPTAITENQFGLARISPRRAIHTTGECQGRSDTFTTTASGTAIDLGAGTSYKYFSLQVVQTGTVTSWTVVLEGSLNGTNYSTILTHTNAAPGSGGIVPAVTAAAFTPFPVRYFRTRCSAITLGAGTNVIATCLGSP